MSPYLPHLPARPVPVGDERESGACSALVGKEATAHALPSPFAGCGFDQIIKEKVHVTVKETIHMT